MFGNGFATNSKSLNSGYMFEYVSERTCANLSEQ